MPDQDDPFDVQLFSEPLDPDDPPDREAVAEAIAKVTHYAHHADESIGGIAGGNTLFLACPPHRGHQMVDLVLGKAEDLAPGRLDTSPTIDLPDQLEADIEAICAKADREKTRVTKMGLDRSLQINDGKMGAHVPSLIEDLRRGLAAWQVLTAFIQAVGHGTDTMPDDLQEQRHRIAHALCTDLVIAEDLLERMPDDGDPDE